MAKTRAILYPVAIRFNPEDMKLIGKLRKKLGVGLSDVLRVALRVLAEKEQIVKVLL